MKNLLEQSIHTLKMKDWKVKPVLSRGGDQWEEEREGERMKKDKYMISCMKCMHSCIKKNNEI
jgi:hypothetical protein